MQDRAPDDACSGIGQCFMSQTATGEKRIYVTYEDQKIYTKLYISLKQLRMNNMQRNSAFDFFCSLEQVWFLAPSLSESDSVFLILTLLL